jgi:hypothetical protein
MAIKSSTNSPRVTLLGIGNSMFALLLMVSLAVVIFLFSAGFHFTDKLYAISSYFFQKIRQLFTFSPLNRPPSSPESSSLFKDLLTQPRADSVPDLETGLNMTETEKGTQEPCRLFPTLLSESTNANDFIKETPEKELEVEMVEFVPSTSSIPKFKSLDMAIEKTTKPSTTPKATYEEWNEPIPIDEEDVPKDINGWCFIGQSKGARACAPVGKMDKCVTGELYANQMECLQIHPNIAVTLPANL